MPSARWDPPVGEGSAPSQHNGAAYRPRIAHLTGELRPYGVSRSVLNLCTATEPAYASSVVVAIGGGPLHELYDLRGIPVLEVFPSATAWHSLPAWRRRRMLLRGLLAHCRAASPDLIHAHSPALWPYGAMVARCLGVPLVLHVRAMVPRLGQGQRLVMGCLRPRLCAAVAASRGAGDSLTRSLGLPFRVVQNALDTREFEEAAAIGSDLRSQLRLGREVPLVATVARADHVKNPAAVARCAAIVHRARPDVHFVVIGDGPMLDDMRCLSSALGIERHIHWLGYRGDVAGILREAAVHLLMSRHEGFGRAVAEAMLLGLPNVATDVPGVNELFTDGVEGYFVPDNDAAAAAARVLELLDRPELRARMGHAGRVTAAQQFTLERLGREMHEVYGGLLNDQAR